MRCQSVTSELPVARSNPVLVPTTLHSNEWWSAHVVHALHRNGILVDREYLIRQLDPRLAGLYPQGVVNRHRAGERCKSGAIAFAGMELPPWAVRGLSSAVQVCQRCLQESGHLRLEWQLRSIGVCHRHAVRLTTLCPKCQARWHVWDAVRGRCPCGFHLMDDRHEVAVALPGGARLQAWPPDRARDEQATKFQEQIACEVVLARLLRDLASKPVAGANRPRLSNGAVDHIAWAESMGALVPPQVESVSKLWSALQSAPHLRLALSLVCRVSHEEGVAPTALSCLPLTRWARELADLGACPRRVVAAGWVKPGQLTAGRMSMKEAARLAGVRRMHVRFLIDKGLITPSGALHQGGKQYVFTLDQVETLKSLQPSAFKAGTNEDPGLEGDARQVMRLSGTVRMREDVHGIDRIDAVALRDLLSQLQARAVDAPVGASILVRLGTKTVWRRRFLGSLPSVFADLCAGRLPVYRCEGAVGLNAFAVGADVLVELRRRAGGRWRGASAPEPGQLAIAGVQDLTWGPARVRSAEVGAGQAPMARKRSQHCPGQLPLMETA